MEKMPSKKVKVELIDEELMNVAGGFVGWESKEGSGFSADFCYRIWHIK